MDNHDRQPRETVKVEQSEPFPAKLRNSSPLLSKQKVTKS